MFETVNIRMIVLMKQNETMTLFPFNAYWQNSKGENFRELTNALKDALDNGYFIREVKQAIKPYKG